MTDVEEAVKCINQFMNSASSFDTQMSKADKRVSELYHEIEFSNYDAKRICKVYKELKAALKQRRMIKNNIRRVAIINAALKDGKLPKTSKFDKILRPND